MERIVTTLVALAIVFAGTPPITAAQTAETSGAPREGIQVHGHWTIDIRNADGTLVSHHDFENDLVPPSTFESTAYGGGSGALAAILGGAYSIRSWRVFVFGSNGVWGTAPQAIVSQATSLVGGFPHIFRTLTVRVPTATRNGFEYAAGTLELEGTATTIAAGTLTGVRTQLETTATGSTQTYADVTGRSLAPIAVAAGQIVQVKVVISFS